MNESSMIDSHEFQKLPLAGYLKKRKKKQILTICLLKLMKMCIPQLLRQQTIFTNHLNWRTFLYEFTCTPKYEMENPKSQK